MGSEPDVIPRGNKKKTKRCAAPRATEGKVHNPFFHPGIPTKKKPLYPHYVNEKKEEDCDWGRVQKKGRPARYLFLKREIVAVFGGGERKRLRGLSLKGPGGEGVEEGRNAGICLQASNRFYLEGEKRKKRDISVASNLGEQKGRAGHGGRKGKEDNIHFP